MNKIIPCVVIKPANYKLKKQKYPVVYLLHGYGGNYSNWIRRMPALKYYASLFNMIIICPDGGFNSWYIDSPVDNKVEYETFITQDLIPFIDKFYNTIAEVKKRGIMGNSMGGYGAIMLAMRHKNMFGAASSMSGIMNLHDVVNKYNTEQKFGDTANYSSYWKQYSINNIVNSFTNRRLRLLFDCGNKDIFINSNRAIHNKLNDLGIIHDYIERTGEHDWQYWINALPYHLLFFRKYFDEVNSKL